MISVCMASYNGERYISQQISSILNQLGESDELIISDDGSTDRTISIIEGFADNRIKLIFNKGLHCYTSNFYNALKHAVGDYIYLSDQDDVWLPNKVKVTQKYLGRYDFVVSDAKIVDSKLNVLNDSRFDKYSIKGGFILTLLRSRYIGCCMAFRRNVLEKLFPVPTYTNRYTYDTWIPLIGEFYFKSSLIHEPLILYRRHDKNVSKGGDSDKMTLISLFIKIVRRPYYFFYVLMQGFRIKF